MKTGKLPESVLKRSILKQVKNRKQEVSRGTGIGEDCALFSFGGQDLAVSTASFSVFRQDFVCAQVMAAVNNMAAGGAIPVGILVSAILPKEAEEEQIKVLMAQVEKACCILDIQAAGGDTRISKEVACPQLTITAFGRADKEGGLSGSYQPGQDVVMTKWAGLGGTAFLVKENRDQLQRRLPSRLLDEAESFEHLISVLPEAAIAVKYGVSGMHDVSRGGIFSALWELAEGAGRGLELDLKKLPIRQETVEVCELLEKNPYELYGAGSLLVVCEQGSQLVKLLQQENIPAALIGKITQDKAKIMWNQEEKRFLDRPAGDKE